MRIAIFGGSFNPVHEGHIRLARHIVGSEACDVDRVWLMVTPRNPLKPDLRMASDIDRLAMARLACADVDGVEASDFEMRLPAPWYSIRTLDALAARYKEDSFRLVIGADNWLLMDRWKEPDEIIRRFIPIVYPRPGYEVEVATLPDGVTYLADAPLTDVSSTLIRKKIENGSDVAGLVDGKVRDYIIAWNLYRRED